MKNLTVKRLVRDKKKRGESRCDKGAGFLDSPRVYCLIKGRFLDKLAHYRRTWNVKVNVCNTILLILTSCSISSFFKQKYDTSSDFQNKIAIFFYNHL